MRFGQHISQETMYMSGETEKAGFGAVESMDIDEEQSAFSRLGEVRE